LTLNYELAKAHGETANNAVTIRWHKEPVFDACKVDEAWSLVSSAYSDSFSWDIMFFQLEGNHTDWDNAGDYDYYVFVDPMLPNWPYYGVDLHAEDAKAFIKITW
jgi:hypothetical protein